MQGFLFTKQECCELSFLIRAELDELLFDLQDPYLSVEQVSQVENRYRRLFQILTRFADQEEIIPYLRNFKTKKMD